MSEIEDWEKVRRYMVGTWKVRDLDLPAWKRTLEGQSAADVLDAVMHWPGKQPPRAPEIRQVLTGSGDRAKAFEWDVRDIERIIALDADYAAGFFDRARRGLQVLTPAARRKYRARLTTEEAA